MDKLAVAGRHISLLKWLGACVLLASCALERSERLDQSAGLPNPGQLAAVGTASALSSAGRSLIVEQAAAALRERYVDPQLGEMGASRIESQLESGAYEAIIEPAVLARQLTEDLAKVVQDQHLRVLSPDPLAELPPPGFIPPPPSEGGVVRADKLVGNVGYVRIAAFAPVELFEMPISRAMEELSDTRALIVDLRPNIGGDPAAVTHLLSYFIGHVPFTIDTSVSRIPGTATFETAETKVTSRPSVTFAGKPLIVLIGRWTVSAGEGFAFNVRKHGLGTLIGETTAGAANVTGNVPIANGFQISVPYQRSASQSWEGVGVSPDIRVPDDQALEVALENLGIAAQSAQVDRLSIARVFTLRTTPQAGSEAALRELIEQIRAGQPDFSSLSPSMAEILRSQLARLQEGLTQLGEVQSLRFLEVDPFFGDVYEVTSSSGRSRWAVALNSAGKIAMWQNFSLGQ